MTSGGAGTAPRPSAHVRWHRDEAGAVVLWLLGLSVVILLLGGLSLDLWRAFSERRAVAAVADAAATAAASGLDEEHWRATGEPLLDVVRAERLAAEALTRQTDVRTVDDWRVAVAPDRTHASVTILGSVDLTLLRLVGRSPLEIAVTATATPRVAGAPVPPG